MRGKLAEVVVLLTIAGVCALALAGCGSSNISKSRGQKLEKGIYETHFQTEEGRRVTCFVLTKEFSSGDQHAVSITCPEFLNRR